MHSKTYLTFFCALCSVALLIGCVTVNTDNLPSDVTKGYVEFYKGDTSGGVVQHYMISIYQFQDGKEIYMGDTGQWAKWSRLRIACRPGPHTFGAKLGDAAEWTQVEVKQDKITPVKITIIPGQSTYSHTTSTYYFRMNLQAEEAIPIK